jgi:hypothetical protein
MTVKGVGGGPFGGAAAAYLGLTPAELRAQLESGKTLAQVAADRGKSVQGLKAAILAGAKTDLDAAVAAGKSPQRWSSRCSPTWSRISTTWSTTQAWFDTPSPRSAYMLGTRCSSPGAKPSVQNTTGWRLIYPSTKPSTQSGVRFTFSGASRRGRGRIGSRGRAGSCGGGCRLGR